MEILKFPHPMLLKPCKKVLSFGPELKLILDEMYETMVKANGRGLAANQVNIDLQAFIMVKEDGTRLNIINPEILWFSEEKSDFKEGCLSSPGTFINTRSRSQHIQVRFQNENSLTRKIFLSGVDAVCFQHEAQHVLKGEAFFQCPNTPREKRRAAMKKWGLKP